MAASGDAAPANPGRRDPFAGWSADKIKQYKKEKYPKDVDKWFIKPWEVTGDSFQRWNGPIKKGTRLLIIGPSGSGKSVATEWILYRQAVAATGQDCIDIPVLMTEVPTSSEMFGYHAPETMIYDEWDERQLESIVEKQHNKYKRFNAQIKVARRKKGEAGVKELIKSLKKEKGRERPGYHHLVLLEDVSGGDSTVLKADVVKYLCKKGRHDDFTTVITEQSLKFVDTAVRSNVNMVMLGYESDAKEQKKFFDHWGSGIFSSIHEFTYYYKILTKPYKMMVLFTDKSGQNPRGALGQFAYFQATPKIENGKIVMPKFQIGAPDIWKMDFIKASEDDDFEDEDEEIALGLPSPAELERQRILRERKRRLEEAGGAGGGGSDPDIPPGYERTTDAEAEQMVPSMSGELIPIRRIATLPTVLRMSNVQKALQSTQLTSATRS